MKKQRMFLGILMIGIGVYFLINQLHIPYMHRLFTWPTLLIIIGVTFLLQSFLAKDHQSIFPGMILTGLGIHFHGRAFFDFWPDHWAIYTLIIGIAFLFRYQKTKNGMLAGTFLLVISILGLFYDGMIEWMKYIGTAVGWMENFWSVVLIMIGVYLLLKK